MFKLQNITDFMDLFRELFELLLLTIDEGFSNKLMRVIFMSISNWDQLPELFMGIYNQNIIKDDR